MQNQKLIAMQYLLLQYYLLLSWKQKMTSRYQESRIIHVTGSSVSSMIRTLIRLLPGFHVKATETFRRFLHLQKLKFKPNLWIYKQTKPKAELY